MANYSGFELFLRDEHFETITSKIRAFLESSLQEIRQYVSNGVIALIKCFLSVKSDIYT